MPDEIKRLTNKFLRDPVKVEVDRQSSTADTIDQTLVKSGSKPNEKRQTLRDRIDAAENLTNAIIFCNRKRDVATLVRSLVRHGYDAGALHGDMDQRSRTETLTTFRKGGLKFLIASDVAARGLDIPAVSHVFNFDVPTHAEDYVHRVGRTGRAGRSGSAITLYTDADGKYVDAIEKLIGRSIERAGKAGKPDDTAGDAKPPRSRSRKRSRGPDKDSARDNPPAAKPEEKASPPKSDKDTKDTKDGNRRKSGDKRSDPFGEDGPVPAFLLRSFAKT